MKVLIACEFSGIVRDAFKRKGHDAWSCDLLPTESKGNHIQDDVTKHLGKGWDLMIAHPPCTYLSNAGARHLYPKGKLNLDRYWKGVASKHFFNTLWESNIPRICIENPVPSKIYKLDKYHQIIQPYWFGHPFSKKTCLWLKNLPLLKPTDICKTHQSTRIKGNWFNKGGKNRQKERSRTFLGIAKAMAEQWS